MRKRTVKCLKKAWMFMLLAVLTLGFIAFPMKAEASWINRDQTGIYYEDSGGGLGQGIGELDEDENAEEVEVDEGSGFFQNHGPEAVAMPAAVVEGPVDPVAGALFAVGLWKVLHGFGIAHDGEEGVKIVGGIFSENQTLRFQYFHCVMSFLCVSLSPGRESSL